MRPIDMLLGGTLALGLTAVPLHAQKPRRASPVLVPPAGAPAAPAPATPASSADSATKAPRRSPTLVNRPGVTVDSSRSTARNAAAQQAVAPQAARPAAAPPPAFSAGLAIAPYEGTSDEDRVAYLRTFTTQLDSATAMLVGVFRLTSGQPLSGAEAPTALSTRERERWARCRDLHFDLQTYATAMHQLLEELPEALAVQRAGAALDSSLTALQATVECDNVTSMITAPQRWTPWAGNYASSARNFYVGWYGQVRDVADRNRAFVMALNAAQPASARIAVPPALPRNPPYAGAGPR